MIPCLVPALLVASLVAPLVTPGKFGKFGCGVHSRGLRLTDCAALVSAVLCVKDDGDALDNALSNSIDRFILPRRESQQQKEEIPV